MSNNTGGPAFPAVRIRSGDNYNSPTKLYYGGMTLRDYFAAKALQGFAATLSGDSAPLFDILAKDAYTMADAMLKQREKP